VTSRRVWETPSRWVQEMGGCNGGGDVRVSMAAACWDAAAAAGGAAAACGDLAAGVHGCSVLGDGVVQGGGVVASVRRRDFFFHMVRRRD
jgi:hypothetical protein